MSDHLKRVPIGVIGAGHLGRFHIECIQRIPGFDLKGIFDIDKDAVLYIAF